MTKKTQKKSSKVYLTEVKSSTKAKKRKYTLVKGFKDILPEDQPYWDFVRDKLIAISKAYGFERLDLPILEDTGLFIKGIGNSTDIVIHEMFSFETLGGEQVSLRPEGTAGVVRAYIEHGMMNKPKPVKIFYLGPMFRYDKPQAGRYRQFYQFGLEIIEEDDPIIDAQLIYLCYQMYNELKIPITIHVNSIGCLKCRNSYIKVLKNYLKKNRSKLCQDCLLRYTNNTLRVLDCKQKKCQEVISGAPQIIDHLCEDCNNHFVKVLEYLDDAQVPYNLDPFIVRGLEYYNRTTFEVFAKDDGVRSTGSTDSISSPQASSPQAGSGYGSQSTLCGGGRYDGLIKTLGGQPTTAIGLSIGLERTIAKLRENKDIDIVIGKRCDVFVAQLGENARKKVLLLFEKLRQMGFSVGESVSKRALKAQLESANRMEAKLSLIIGQKEILDKTILIRDMESGGQEIVPEEQIIKVLKRRLHSLNIKK